MATTRDTSGGAGGGGGRWKHSAAFPISKSPT